MDWRPVQGVPAFALCQLGSAPAPLMRISGIDNGWMDYVYIYVTYYIYSKLQSVGWCEVVWFHVFYAVHEV